MSRRACEDVDVHGYTLPAGSNVIVSPWVTHHDERFFPNPEEFRPERWATAAAQELPKFAYLPFGGGPRACIGNNFALIEAAIILTAVAQRFEVSLAEGARVEPIPSITLRPVNGVWVKLRRRGAASRN
jgi:cytochrome P450